MDQLSNSNAKLLNSSGIYERYHKASLKEYKGKSSVIKVVNKYMDSTDGRGLFIQGPNGIGKSYVVCAAFIELLARGLPVFKVQAQIAHQWYLDKNHAKMKLISSAYFLCIDDFVKERYDSPA
jgi:DNA replication protein DnaC